MSITPVREALRILQADGLVSYDEHRSISATELAPGDADEIYTLRSFLEGLAAQWAAERRSEPESEHIALLHAEFIAATERGDEASAKRANREWHFSVYGAAHTKFLADIISRLWTRVEWNTIWGARGQLEKSVGEHGAITESIRQQDGRRAGELMRMHLNGGRAAVEKVQAGKG